MSNTVTTIGWDPMRPSVVSVAPNVEAVARGLQTAANSEAVKAARGRTGFDIGSDWNVSLAKEPLAGCVGLYESTVNSLNGPSGVGKSLIVLSLAASACLAGTPVVILAAEHAAAWRQRYEVWCDVNNNGVPLSNFHIVGEEGSKAAVADPDSFLYELTKRRLAGALVVLDTAGASGVDLGSTTSAKAFMKRLQHIADSNESCVLFVNHEYVNGKQAGNAALHNNIANRFRCGRLEDGTTELVMDRDRFSTSGTPSPIRYKMERDAQGREYLVQLGSDHLPESRLRAEVLNCVALTDGGATSRQICRGLGLTAARVTPDVDALVRAGHLVLSGEGVYSLPA